MPNTCAGTNGRTDDEELKYWRLSLQRHSNSVYAIDPEGLLPLPFGSKQSYHAYLTMTAGEIRTETETLVKCYEEQVLTFKTRRVELLGRKCEPEMMHTFLGFEVKLGLKRLTCPDMTTARYLRIFGKLGMESILIPYDPTRTASVLPLLEGSMERIDSLLASGETELQVHQRRARRTYQKIRKSLQKAERRRRLSVLPVSPP